MVDAQPHLGVSGKYFDSLTSYRIDLVEYDTYNAVMTSPYHYQVKPPLCVIGEVNFTSDVTTHLIHDVHNSSRPTSSIQVYYIYYYNKTYH